MPDGDDDGDDGGDFDGGRKRTSIIGRLRRLTLSTKRRSVVVEELNVDEAFQDCRGSSADRDQFSYLLYRIKKGSTEVGRGSRPVGARLLRRCRAQAMFSVGYLYDIGAGGVECRTTEAIKWYREAAANGHAIAMNNLGVLLSTGHRGRVPPDNAEASHWYKASAAKGYVSGQFHLGTRPRPTATGRPPTTDGDVADSVLAQA